MSILLAGVISWKLPQLVGLIKSVKECIEYGVTSKLKHLLHAEMFDSLVSQAKGLLETGHKVPAAVLLRIVLERWLRNQGDHAGLPNWGTPRHARERRAKDCWRHLDAEMAADPEPPGCRERCRARQRE